MSYEHIKKNFKKKKIDDNFDQSINLDNDLESFFRYNSETEEKLSNLDKNFIKWSRNDKKSDIIIDMLNKEIKEKDNEIYMQERKNNAEHKKYLKICKKMIEVIDLIDTIYDYAKKSNNKNLERILEKVYKKINRSLSDIGMEAINPIMEIMNPELHECLEVKDIEEYNSSRIKEDKLLEDTIIDVVKKGYKLDGDVLRAAKVIIVQNKKITSNI